MADDFEYDMISDPDVSGFFTGPDGSESDFLSEDICKAAKVARRRELRDIKRLRRRLESKLRSGNIAASTYERGIAILDAQQDVLERADQPAKSRLPEPLSPYSSPMMDSLPVQPTPLLKVVRPKVVGRGAGNFRDTPRQEARRAGLRRYWSESLCPRGHNSERYVSTGQCVVCVTACVRGYRAANPERAREVQRAWRVAHPEKSREYVRNKRDRRKLVTVQ